MSVLEIREREEHAVLTEDEVQPRRELVVVAVRYFASILLRLLLLDMAGRWCGSRSACPHSSGSRRRRSSRHDEELLPRPLLLLEAKEVLVVVRMHHAVVVVVVVVLAFVCASGNGS